MASLGASERVDVPWVTLMGSPSITARLPGVVAQRVHAAAGTCITDEHKARGRQRAGATQRGATTSVCASLCQSFVAEVSRGGVLKTQTIFGPQLFTRRLLKKHRNSNSSLSLDHLLDVVRISASPVPFYVSLTRNGKKKVLWRWLVLLCSSLVVLKPRCLPDSTRISLRVCFRFENLREKHLQELKDESLDHVPAEIGIFI